MKRKLSIVILCAICLAGSARASDVYWVDKNNQIRQQWHVEDGLNDTWFKSESKKRCLAQVELFKALAGAVAVDADKEDNE